MLTSVDKALAAFLMGLISLAAMFWPPIAEHVGEREVAALTTLIGPAIVWLVPNKVAK